MKRLLLTYLSLFISLTAVKADKGMWLPMLIGDRIEDMQSKGFKLSAEDLYSTRKASLKDAVVFYGRGCTGELLSNEGLLLTNHHCGFREIQSHSSVENDLLKDGFWALNREDELPNPGLSVKFLVRMDDVTSKVLKGCRESMSEEEQGKIIARNSKKIVAKATRRNHYNATVEPLFYGNQYFLFVYEEFTDVRLVGTPPTSIGKFGGDLDNWMWPRHSADFALFRIYADKNNKPAPYSKNNVPYRPKKHFTISTKGVEEGDFTMIYGFPGRTQQYIHSQAVDYILNYSNPHKVNLRTKRLEVQREEMAKSDEVRIKYAAKNASVANAWKRWQGESKGLLRLNTIGNKERYERELEEWALANNNRYIGVTKELEKLISQRKPYAFALDYYNEAIRSNELFRFASTVLSIAKRGANNGRVVIDDKGREELLAFYKDYYEPLDKKAFIAVVNEYQANLNDSLKPQQFKDAIAKYGSVQAYADHFYSETALADSNKLYSLLAESNAVERLNSDPAILFYRSMYRFNRNNVYSVIKEIDSKIDREYKRFMAAQMEFSKGNHFHPDANRTLRIAYGIVGGYHPADGVYYTHLSTLDGIIEKNATGEEGYWLPEKMKEIYRNRDYGEWEVNGTVPVNFVASNHTSGGNSGSPIINSVGELVGINFDRVWEGTMSDIEFDPVVCRNVSVDVRYILFIIDKYAGARSLIDEMTIRK